MATRKLFAHEIVAHNDEELDQYLRETGRLVSVHDPQNLPESFIHRLRDKAHETSRSCPVDLDQVSVRLLQISPNPPAVRDIIRQSYPFLARVNHPLLAQYERDSPEAPSTPSSSSSAYRTYPEEERQRKLAREREYYDDLVQDGCHPWYPIDLMDEVSKHPEKHRQLLQYWQQGAGVKPDNWEVFGGQMHHWMQFREWQEKRRDEFKGRSLSEYNRWAKSFLLNRHSYTAPVEFEFDEDPKRQDKRTTWMEYLLYEHHFYAQRYAWYERRGKWYDKQWRKLADSGVLRPHETREFILNKDSAYYSEIPQAEKAVESARSAVSSAQQAIDPSRPSSLIQQRLATAQAQLDSASRSLKSVKKRHELIAKFHQDTYRYGRAKDEGERHTILLQWVLEQVPLIELELRTEAAESTSGGQKRKRGLERGQDDITEDQNPKRQNWNAPDECSHDDTIDDEPRLRNGRQPLRSRFQILDDANTATVRRPRGSRVLTRRKDAGKQEGGRRAAPLRRSARIAAREELSKSHDASSNSIGSLDQPRWKTRQAPTSPLSTGSQDRWSRSQAAKTRKRSSPGSNRVGRPKPTGISKSGCG